MFVLLPTGLSSYPTDEQEIEYRYLLRDLSKDLGDGLIHVKMESYRWLLSDLTQYILKGDGEYPDFWSIGTDLDD